MIRRYNNLSFVFGVPGLILQVAGDIMRRSQPQPRLGVLVLLAGTVLLLIGLA
jgi:hypothetical protein